MPPQLLTTDVLSANPAAGASFNEAPTTATLRVLHVINGEHYSGAERVQDLLGLRLPEFGVQTDFAALKPGKFAVMRRAHDCAVYELRMGARIDLRPVLKLRKLIREQGYQIVHTHTARSALVGHLAAKLCGVPHVHHLHSPTACDTTRWLANRANMLIEYGSLRRADAIIPVSHTLGQYAQRHGLAGQLLRVVPNGVPVHGPLKPRSTPQGAWVLGTVALFRPRKGLEVLLAALARLRSQNLPVRLRAVGGFESEAYEQEVKSLADQLGLTTAIDWTGFTRDVNAELGKMDLFVLPSLFGEGLPMVVLEAMAAGVPLVATRVEGVPEAVRDTMDGLLAAPGDVQDLSARIADFVQGRIDWQTVRTAAHTRQAEMFSDRSMAEGVAKVYRQVLAQRQQKKNSPTQRLLEPLNAPETKDLADPYQVTLMGTRIDNVTLAQAVKLIVNQLDQPVEQPPAQVSFVNADCINISYRDRAYRQVLADSRWVFADGIGMKIAGRALKQPLVDNVNGTDLFPRLCLELAKRQARLYLLGAQPGVADEVARWVKQFFPRVAVCGTRDGYFKPHELPGVLAEIRESQPDVLLVALGVPRQEKWLAEHLPELGCKVAIGVGGLFDFYSQRVPRAPLWMRQRGLEWLYRLLQEPRRLARRYLLGNPLFLLRLVGCCLFGDRSPLPPAVDSRYDSDSRYVPSELASANA